MVTVGTVTRRLARESPDFEASKRLTEESDTTMG